MMNNFYLNYDATADVITVIISMVLTILIKSTYVRNDKMFKMFKVSMFATTIASLSSILFHTLAIEFGNYWVLVYILRNTCLASLMFILLLYNLYVVELIGLEPKLKKIFIIVLQLIYIAGTILECITPLTHFGFYIENGKIYENFILSTFTFVYIYYILSIIYMIIKSYKRIMHKIIKNLFIVMIISISTMIAQYIMHSSTYICFTFLLPILSVLFLFHNNTYDTKLLTLDVNAFSSYISELSSKKKEFAICSLYMGKIDDLKNLTTIFFKYYKNIINNAYSFKINDKKIIIVYKNIDNVEYNNKLKNAFENLLKEYKDSNINFKMVIVKSNNFLYKTGQYIKFTKYVEANMPINSCYEANDKDIEKFKTGTYILSQLQDINAKHDLNDERIVVYCQPIYNVKENIYDTAEALMRLNLPDTGLIYPDVFIPLAESNGCIHTLSKIILNKVCKELNKLEKDNYDIKRISVNFVTKELSDKNFVTEIKEIIQNNNVEFSKIGVEITESENVENFIEITDTINELRDNNITVYIDDFGTGYSNFEKTLTIPIDIIKFDKSLVTLLQSSNSYKIMVGKFADIFDELNYSILFEGIETKDDEHKCIGMNAHYLQGYLYSRPVPIENLNIFLKKQE